MSTVFFPSCRVLAGYPETSKKIAEYVKRRYGMRISGCCRSNLQALTEEDTAVCICNTCSAFCNESAKAQEVISLWEMIANDEQFPFPDYQGEEIALQDCWRAYDKRPMQDAVRMLMRKMNIRVIELPENYTNTRFCGTTVLQKAAAYYAELAPKRFGQNVPADFFQQHLDEDNAESMRAHCVGIPTERVACYCVGCANGINLGGKKAIHMAELLFSTIK